MNVGSFLNLDILKTPVNWLIIWLVLAFAGVALTLVINSGTAAPPTGS